MNSMRNRTQAVFMISFFVVFSNLQLQVVGQSPPPNDLTEYQEVVADSPLTKNRCFKFSLDKAKLVPCADWQLPDEYSGLTADTCGVFLRPADCSQSFRITMRDRTDTTFDFEQATASEGAVDMELGIFPCVRVQACRYTYFPPSCIPDRRAAVMEQGPEILYATGQPCVEF